MSDASAVKMTRVYHERDVADALGVNVEAVRQRCRTGVTLRGWNSKDPGNPMGVWLVDADYADAHVQRLADAHVKCSFVCNLRALGPTAPAQPQSSWTGPRLALALSQDGAGLELEDGQRPGIKTSERELQLIEERAAERELRFTAERDAALKERDAALREVENLRRETQEVDFAHRSEAAERERRLMTELEMVRQQYERLREAHAKMLGLEVPSVHS